MSARFYFLSFLAFLCLASVDFVINMRIGKNSRFQLKELYVEQKSFVSWFSQSPMLLVRLFRLLRAQQRKKRKELNQRREKRIGREHWKSLKHRIQWKTIINIVWRLIDASKFYNSRNDANEKILTGTQCSLIVASSWPRPIYSLRTLSERRNVCDGRKTEKDVVFFQDGKTKNC